MTALDSFVYDCPAGSRVHAERRVIRKKDPSHVTVGDRLPEAALRLARSPGRYREEGPIRWGVQKVSEFLII